MKHRIFSIIILMALIAVYLLFKSEPFVWSLMGVIVLVFIFVITFGVFQIKANYFINSINRGEKSGISLTFDDGPDPVFTPQILKILDAHKLVGTFFIIGKKAEAYPELLKQINQRGHIIGNHSFSHNPDFPFYSSEKLKADIQRCSNIIKTLTGKKIQFFRAPFGVTNPRYGKVLEQLDLQSIGWNVRSFDTVFKNRKSLFKRITKKLASGSIILLHDTQAITLQTLPEIIRFCEEEGIKILPLDKLIDKQPHESE